jgi:hypothetical protein
LLPESANAPLPRQVRRVLALLESRQVERLDHVLAENVLLSIASELEDAAPESQDPALRVADHEACARCGVVVVQELEEVCPENPSTPSTSTERCLQLGQMNQGTGRW